MAEIGGSPSAPHQPFFPGPAAHGEPDMENQLRAHVCVRAGEQVRRSPLRSQLLADLDALDLGALPFEDEASTAASSDGAHEGGCAANGVGKGAEGLGFDLQAFHPDTLRPFDDGGHETELPRSYYGESSNLVTVLNTFTADRFFLDTSRQVKAVLFTKKAQIPTLWQQVATELAHHALFGLVRDSETELLERFALEKASLPRILVFCPGHRLTYTGPAEDARQRGFL